MEIGEIRKIVEAALLVAGEPLSVEQIERLFLEGDLDSEEPRGLLRNVLGDIETGCAERGYELVRVASGYRFQVREAFSERIGRLWEQKPPRYSRALLETLALIAYRQPATRGDVEEVRGVSVSSNIVRTLMERGWIREVGQREVPGRPVLYATTKEFLDYFNLKSLADLPPLSEVKTLIEPVLFQEGDEVRNAINDSGAELESHSADVPIALDQDIDNASTLDVREETGDEINDERDSGESDERRPLAEVVELPRPD
ncbi:MAG: SMC-Scp complex subunit ScpB [Pseudomonadota bacterium]|nr:SMC-Scp complex subunit ScpB [Pseudomonadota bacterium]